jgi:LacI family transcriptional regulator
MKSTIQNVARHAGVSIGTVSNSLTGKHPVAEATYQRILAAMEELGYQLKRMARGLLNQHGYVLSIVIKELTNSDFMVTHLR